MSTPQHDMDTANPGTDTAEAALAAEIQNDIDALGVNIAEARSIIDTLSEKVVEHTSDVDGFSYSVDVLDENLDAAEQSAAAEAAKEPELEPGSDVE